MTANILFHQFKHHLPTLRGWVGNNGVNVSPAALLTIKTLGNSQLYMYCGNLAVNSILLQVGYFLHAQGITQNGQYRQWVGTGYKLLELSDGSRFTLRRIHHYKPGHLNPARHAPLAMRIKANALKTAVCCKIAVTAMNIEALNLVRQKYLGLPPVAAGADIAEILKAASLFA